MENEPVLGTIGRPPKGVSCDDNPLYEKCKKYFLRDY